MHRGTDFMAPSGTPIMASGSGTLQEQDGGGGGNCVKIKHNSTYEKFMRRKILQRYYR